MLLGARGNLQQCAALCNKGGKGGATFRKQTLFPFNDNMLDYHDDLIKPNSGEYFYIKMSFFLCLPHTKPAFIFQIRVRESIFFYVRCRSKH